MNAKWIGLAAAACLVTGCSSDPHVQNSAPASGALIGAIAGGAIGAAKGCADEGGCDRSNHHAYYDQRAGRYYYYDNRDGRYYWEDGSRRY